MPRSTRALPRLAVLGILTLISIPARADSADELTRDMAAWADRVETMRTRGQIYNGDKLTPEACVARIEAALAAGIPASQALVSAAFATHRKAQKTASGDAFITVNDAREYCAAYAPHQRFYVGRKPFDAVAARHGAYAGVSVSAATAAELRPTITACREAWDTLHAAGVPDDLPVHRITGIATFGELKAGLCDDFERELTAGASQTAANEQAARARWEAAGARGEQLALLVRYDGVGWRLPGGAVSTDPAKLAKAPVLFQWLVGPDPADDRYEVHTIRKYRFKAGAVTVGEKTYRREKGRELGKKVFR